MILHYVLILLSLGLLYGGAEMLVKGSASVAARAGLTPLMIGLTVVAFGTSSPEIAVSLEAALMGHGDVAVGNVIGSNIFNILSILGISALVMPITVNGIQVLDYAVMVGVALLILPFLMTGLQLARVEGAILLGLYGGYLYLLWPK